MSANPSSERRVALVVGASAGIGLATAEGLLRQGFRVILGCRNATRGQGAVAELQRATGLEAEFLALDLESLASLQSAVEELHRRCSRLDVLIHNAGVVYPQRRTTADGWEAQLAVIYLSPFWLTQQVEGLLLGGHEARVVNVVSDLHRGGCLNFDDFHMQRGYHFLSSYRRAELAKILWTYQLARRWQGTAVSANCVHPGGVRSQLFRHFRGPLGWLIWLSGWLKQSPQSGARGSLQLALSPSLKGVSGQYFVGIRRGQSSAVSRDERLAERLWSHSQDVIAATAPS